MNIDIYHPDGRPHPMQLAGYPFIRMPLDASVKTGRYNWEQTFQDYSPYVSQLLAAGKKVIFVLTHQTWGEGVGEYPDWNAMDLNAWRRFIPQYVQAVRNLITRFASRGIIWQVWNEPDSTEGIASVRLTPQVYGELFRSVQGLIRSVDPSSKVITAGFNSGPERGFAYFKEAQIAPDAIAIHPYGRGALLNPDYRNWGTIEYELDYWKTRTTKEIMITEFGVLNRVYDPVAKVSAYAKDFIAVCIKRGVRVLCWYAWGRQHNGYGCIAPDGSPRAGLIQALQYQGSTVETPTQTAGEIGYTTNLNMNLRESPSTSARVFLTVPAGETFYVQEKTYAREDGHHWKQVRFKGQLGWMALIPGSVRRITI